MKQPEAIVNFEVYKDSVNLVGVAKVTLPVISYITQSVTGAGMAGTVDAVLTGMVEAMSLSLNFLSSTDAAIDLLKPERHNIDLRVASQYWDTVATKKMVQADKYVMVVVPKSFSPGSVATASTSDASGEYSCYYYAGYKDGKQLWEIDPYNYVCDIGGVDYMKPVRKALGK